VPLYSIENQYFKYPINNEGVVLLVFEMYKSIDFQASVDTFSEAPIRFYGRNAGH